jgi:DegV family protein with EDD domain
MLRIVTDSTCDLPAAVLDAHGISVVPVGVRTGDRVVTPEALTGGRFWELLTSRDDLPETVAPSAGAFQDRFEALGDEGADGILAVCVSSELSATYAAAVIAAERLAGSLPVRVVDSRLVSAALGLTVLAAADAADEMPADLDRVAARTMHAAKRTNLFAALDTIDYLRRGGRVGRVEAVVGGALDVKPLITLANGVVAGAGRTLGRTGAHRAIVAKARELADRIEAVAVVHAAAPDVQAVVAEIERAIPSLQPIVTELGPVVGTHTGPGAIGIAYRLS